MGSIIVIFTIIAAIFMGIYYIGSEYRIGTGFCAIALGIIILIAFNAGKFDDYINEDSHDQAEYVQTEVIHDTINLVHVHEVHVHDTIYLTMTEPVKQMEDSIEVEIISEIPLTEDEVDSLADAVIYNH